MANVGDQVGGPARRLLERLAWFAPEPVPDFMLDVPLPGMAAEDLDEALADLSSYSLVRRNPARREFSVHRLVQDVTRRSLGGEDAHAALMDALTWLEAGFTGDANDLAVRADMESFAPHVRFAVECGDDYGISIPTAALAARLADLLQDRVPLHDIEPLYRRAFAIFDRLAKADPGNAGWQRDLSVSYDRGRRRAGGAGQSARGAAKPSATRLAIRDRLAKADPGNAGWQRDLSVSYNKVGDVLVAQGNLPEALKASATASPSPTVWPRPTPATPAGSATCRCRTTRSATCWWRRAICPRRSKLPRRPRHQPTGWPRPTPATPAGSATCRCRTTRSATCWWRRAICPRR